MALGRLDSALAVYVALGRLDLALAVGCTGTRGYKVRVGQILGSWLYIHMKTISRQVMYLTA